MVIIAQAPAAAVNTVASAATSITSQVSLFNVIAGEPGAGLQLGLNLPGTAKLNGKQFVVRASGVVKLTAGTCTVTVQPLVYGAITNGFTAAVTNAIYSAAAISVTQAAASAKYVPWAIQITVEGDDASGLVSGFYSASYNNGVVARVSPTAIDNPPTTVDFDAEPPLQFSAGVTALGAVNGWTNTLSQLTIEA